MEESLVSDENKNIEAEENENENNPTLKEDIFSEQDSTNNLNQDTPNQSEEYNVLSTKNFTEEVFTLKEDIFSEQNSTNNLNPDTPNQTKEHNVLSTTNLTEEVFTYPNYIFSEKLLLLGNRILPSNESQNYVRGCKWSPDGTCLLNVIHHLGMSVLELPTDLYACNEVNTRRERTNLEPVIKIQENGLVYDFCWYPKMISSNPASCCWASTSQNGPVQLWDAFTGELRCSYRGYDLVDEVEAALSVEFSVSGDRIYCGYKKALRVFDTDRPGRDFMYYKLKTPVSCIATCLARPGFMALGSWRKQIDLVNDVDNTVQSIQKLTNHDGGITNLKFSPDGQRLYSGARKNNELVCWDLRSFGKPLFVVSRESNTNQRIYLDVSPNATWLFTGGTDGKIQIWDVTSDSLPITHFEFQLHNDCINSISVHPYRPILATGSGQHHFFSELIDDETCDNIPTTVDNSISLWWLGKQETCDL